MVKMSPIETGTQKIIESRISKLSPPQKTGLTKEQRPQEKLAARPRCPRCGNRLRTIYVHGHEQCIECDQVIDDCCQGEVSCEQQK